MEVQNCNGVSDFVKYYTDTHTYRLKKLPPPIWSIPLQNS